MESTVDPNIRIKPAVYNVKFTKLCAMTILYLNMQVIYPILFDCLFVTSKQLNPMINGLLHLIFGDSREQLFGNVQQQ